jgi:hypothetical protein
VTHSGLIRLDKLALRGRCIITSREVFSRKILDQQVYFNTLSPDWIKEVVKDLARGTQASAPKALVMSREVIDDSPFPLNFAGSTDGEFRCSVRRYPASGVLQIIGVLGPSQGNGSGNIKSVGFAYGSGATLVAGTGNLGSVINTANVTKDPSIELTFQYEVEFAEA